MKKFLSMLLVVLMVIGIIAGCGTTEAVDDTDASASESAGTSEDTEAMTDEDLDGAMIAICQGSVNHPVHRIVQVSFFKRAEELGYMGVLSGLDEGSQQEMISKWESAITNGAIGCLVWTGDESCYEFMRSYAEDCKFVVPHFAHEYEDTKEFIGRNITCLAATYGADAADYVLAKLAEKGITSGTIALTQSGANVTENAAGDAFRSQIVASGTNFTVADVIYEGLEVTEATNKCTAIISSTPDIVGAFGTTGGSAQAWDAAMTSTGKTDLVVVGVDYIEKNIQLVKGGSISAIVAQPLYIEAQECVNSLDEMFRGKDFAASEEDWFLELDAPIARLNGSGDEDIASYDSIIEMVKTYFDD